MARKKTKAIRTVLINPFSETSVKPDKPPSGSSMRCYSGQARESFARYSTARSKLAIKLYNDFWNDIPVSPTLKKRSYLLTRNEDGSLDLTDVQYVSLETASEHADTCVCLATFKTVKLL